MKCPNCEAEVVGKFCSYCGSELPKKEPNIHIEHNETIINNYGGNQKPNYDAIYEEEKMRARARGRIVAEAKAEADRQSAKATLIGFLVFAVIVVFVYLKISSWWDGITEDGIEPITKTSVEYENAIDINNNKDFFETFSDDKKDKWYRMSGTIENVSEHSFYIYVDEENNHFSIYLEDNINGNDFKEGQILTIVGHLSHGSINMIYFDHCIIDAVGNIMPNSEEKYFANEE